MKLLSFIGSLLIIGSASAADITVYYSPTCPHCHHALDFFSNELVYEFKTLKVQKINVMEEQNLPAFKDALAKCNYESGGVPVIVVGEKCFQGYAPSMNQEFRDAVAVGLSDQEKTAAEAAVKAFNENPETFKAKNADRTNAISELGAVEQKPVEENSGDYFYLILAALVVGLGFVMFRKKGAK